jgi:membrane protease YdiL (CAAX protease family)
MENQGQSNYPAGNDVFAVVNNYFLLFFCISCVISSLFIQQLFMSVGQYRAGIGISSLFGIVLPVTLLLRKFPGGFTGQIRLTKPRVLRLVLVAAATIATLFIIDQVYLLTQRFTPVPEDYTQQIRELKPANSWQLVITAIGLCVLVPISEEMVFRGMIQRIFSRNMGPVIGVLLAGAIFGAVHLSAHLLISITLFGWFLGFLFESTGNLAYSMVAHALFNGWALWQLVTGADIESGNLPFYLRDVWYVVAALVLLPFLVRKISEGGSEAQPLPETAPAEPLTD